MNMPTQAHFEGLYAADSDPWRVAESWYEKRKRAIVLAALPARHFHHVFEPGCGTGDLTVALAQRCDRLLASDFSERAVAIARDKIAAMAHVDVLQQSMPEDWPAAHAVFDLIVISEFCYYLPSDAMPELVRAAVDSLAPAGCLVLCHGLHLFDDHLQSAGPIHRMFGSAEELLHAGRYADCDFMLDILRKESADTALSIREKEGGV